jgi:hypothetical protein
MPTIKEIQPVLMEANRRGFADPDIKSVKEIDGSHTISIDVGNGWMFHDNFFGGEPYGGREVLSYLKKPVWMAVYYGNVDNAGDPKEIYHFLKKALAAQPEAFPVRGPKSLKLGALVYENYWEGNLDNFSGSESILENGREVYRASYIGGFVDTRRG